MDAWDRPWASLYNVRLGVSKEVEIRKQKYHGLQTGDIIKAIFRDKQIKKYVGVNDEGKNIYQDTGKTRRWVWDYQKIDR